MLEDFEKTKYGKNDLCIRHTRLSKGIFCGDGNIGRLIENLRDLYPDFSERLSYGFADSVQQIIEFYPEIESSERKFCIELEEIEGEEKIRYLIGRGKFGFYIGTDKSPKKVFMYNVYELV